MDHPLDDCRLKVARAKEQFDSLQREVSKFAQDNPCPVEISLDPKTGEQVINLPKPPAFPRRWGVIVGEIGHNLRSSLDYLVGVFVREAGREPNGDNAFPISKSKTRYLRKKRGITYRDRVLRGVPDSLKKRIDALQPYRRGDMAYADMLFALSTLSNRDKHRNLHPAYAWINTPRRAFAFPGDIKLKRVEIRVFKDGETRCEADFTADDVMHGDHALVTMFPKVQVQRPTGVEVVFGRDPDKLIGLDDLRELILYVEGIIESFAGDVDSPESAAA